MELNKLPIYIGVKAAVKYMQPLLFLTFLITMLFNPLIGKGYFIKTISKPTSDSVINLNSPDIKFLQQAIFKSINNFRAKNKVALLVWSDTLFKSANFHLTNMQTKKFFDHTNPSDKSYPDLKKRVRKFYGQYSYLSENLIQYFPFKFKGATIQYNIKKNKARYQYFDPVTLKPLQVLTYGQLAEQIVNNWATSPPHRKNMLNSQYYRVGIAVSFPKYYIEPTILPLKVVANFASSE